MHGFTARKFAFLAVFLPSLVSLAAAQDKDRTADENIDLNIVEERLSETRFERSTAIEATAGDKNLTVRVGVGVSADSVTLTLRGIAATGRFRASLEKITRVIERARPER
jgi:hypothetical protein